MAKCEYLSVYFVDKRSRVSVHPGAWEQFVSENLDMGRLRGKRLSHRISLWRKVEEIPLTILPRYVDWQSATV